MQLSEGTILQLVTYLVTLSATGGAILWRIKELEKKVEKHNGLVERMVVVEQSTKSAHHRLDHIEKEVEA
jgi:tetrahydromethanopterin S-methyltransferase subunit G